MLLDAEFWVGIAFVIFVASAYKQIKKVIINVLDKRENRIRDELNYIDNLQKEAHLLLTKHKHNKKNIEAEIAKIEHNNKIEIEKLKQYYVTHIKELIDNKTKRINNKIISHENQLLVELKANIVDNITNNVLCILQKELTTKESVNAESINRLLC